MSVIRPQLEVICNDVESRSLLEQLKISCSNGWFFETLRITPEGLMIYKFFLIDLLKQKQVENEQYVRYYGWVEASETNDSIVVRPSGDLEKFVPDEVRELLMTRFHDDVFEPVCRRMRMRVMFAR